MTFSKQLKFVKIKEFLSAALKLAAERLFFTFIILILIALLLGLSAFYKYGILPQKAKPEIGAGSVRFEENIYQKILEEWASRGERFEAAKTKEYLNPFSP